MEGHGEAGYVDGRMEKRSWLAALRAFRRR